MLTRLLEWLKARVPLTGIDAIREQNRREQAQFGDGTHAPHWPDDNGNWNSESTLRRGVWVDDRAPMPSDRELDAFREAHQRSHDIIAFTLVEGNQDAPFGINGRFIRVRASLGIPGTISDASGQVHTYVPFVQVQPVDSGIDGYWGETFMGTLPCAMTVKVKRQPSRGSTEPTP